MQDESNEILIRWVRFYGHGVELEGVRAHVQSLESGRRKPEFDPDYVLPDMILNIKTGTLKIGRDRIPAGAIMQYRVF